MIDIKVENIQLNSIWCAYSSYMNMLHILIWKVYLSPMESNMWANNLRIRFFSYLSELVLCPCNNSKLGRRSKMTSAFLFPSCHEAVTWKSFQRSVFSLAYRQIFIAQEFGMRTKHWWQGRWKVELHSIFFQWFMFSSQQPPVFQTRQVSNCLLLYVETESCPIGPPPPHPYSVAFSLATIVFLFVTSD